MAPKESLEQVIAESPLGISEDDLVQAIHRLEHSGAGLGVQIATPGAALSQQSADFLSEHSGISETELHKARTARGSWAAQRAVEDAVDRVRGYTTVQVDQRLGITESRVRHRKAEGRLYAMDSGRSLVFPEWQFTRDDDGRMSVLPHLDRVLATLPTGMHPVEVEDFVMRRREELTLGGKPLSVHEWLTTGGDPQPVLDVAESMHVLG